MKKFLEYVKENVDLDKQLLNASKNDDLEKVKELISKGADIETKDNDDYTPLNIASYKGHLEIVKYLVEQGADIESKDNDGDTPLDCEKDNIWSRLDVQELLMEQDPMNISLLKKHDIPIHPELKNKYPSEVIGSDFGSI